MYNFVISILGQDSRVTQIDNDEVRIAIKVVDSFQLVDKCARPILGLLLSLFYQNTLKWVKMPLEEDTDLRELLPATRAETASEIDTGKLQ